jgi:hypothetical protein
LDVQEKDGHENAFSFGTGHNSADELAEEEEERYMKKGTDKIMSRRISCFRHFS